MKRGIDTPLVYRCLCTRARNPTCKTWKEQGSDLRYAHFEVLEQNYCGGTKGLTSISLNLDAWLATRKSSFIVMQNLLLQLLLSSDLLDEQWHLDDIELIVQFLDLLQVLLLHFSPRIALLAWVILLGEEQLIDDD
jgi:hypothetical protein